MNQASQHTLAATPIQALLVEAFTEVSCRGNGAAVVLLPRAADADWMQALACSLNQSETAFLLPGTDGWCLRWFTPTCEVPLCGHATLAALLALRHWQLLDADSGTQFHTRSGVLPAALSGSSGQIELPAQPLLSESVPTGLRSTLREAGVESIAGFWRSSLGYSVVLLEDSIELAELRLALNDLETAEASGLVLMQPVEALSSRPTVLGHSADYQLRFFAPGLGIDEDPVTGSAHALVAPYWFNRLGRNWVAGWQCSARPGGMLCEMASSGMIRLSGAGSVLWQGDLLIPLDDSGSASLSWQAACGNS
ncbi:MAG: PhzF family phenazine biosynthesis protein [Prochlorococcaceae cyanobacterium]